MKHPQWYLVTQSNIIQFTHVGSFRVANCGKQSVCLPL